MKTTKQAHNWWIDVLLLVGYLFSFYLDMTGVIIHQWLGTAVTILAGVHLIMHWDWVKAITVRFFKVCNGRSRVFYLADFLIMLGFVVIAETGLLISTWFSLENSFYLVFLDIHIYASVITLLLTLLKVGLHWRWVVTITARIFGTPGQTVPQRVPVFAQVQLPSRKVNQDRRRFLALMGVIGASSLLAVSNVVTLNAILQAQAHTDTSIDQGVTSINGTLQAVQGENTLTKPLVTTEDNPEEVGATPEQPVATANAQRVADSSNCTVHCPQGCSFPGHCRRYIDQNNNSKCDLGECL